MEEPGREDGSFCNEGGRRGGKRGGNKGGPQFTRVIPKFLQKYHEPSGIDAKFPLPLNPPDNEGEKEEFDEVEKAAMEEYIQKDKEKKKKSLLEENKQPTKRQRIAEMGSGKRKKEKKEKDTKKLDNRKLLSFSMEDE